MGMLCPRALQLQFKAETPQLTALCSCCPTSDPLFGSNPQRFALPAAKPAPGRWVRGHERWESSLGLRLHGRRVLLAERGSAARTSLSAVYPPRLGAAWESSAGCGSLLSSSSSWKLSTRPSAVRPVAASVSRCHFGSASAGSSRSCRHPSPTASPARFTTVWLQVLSTRAPARWSP